MVVGALLAVMIAPTAAGARSAVPAARAFGHVGSVAMDAPLPATLEYFDGRPRATIAGSVDFGQSFQALTTVCFSATFGADALGPGEAFEWTFEGGDGGGGQANNGPDPLTSVTTCAFAFQDDNISPFFDGSQRFVLQVTGNEPELQTASVQLTGVTVLANGVADVADCTVVGTDGPDVLLGTAANDVVCGLGGDDLLFGYAGDDLLVGGAGKDRGYGGDGTDLLEGGDQGDTLFGGAGTDTLRGDNGWDAMYGGDDFDWVLGGSERDYASGEGGTDWIELGSGDNQVAFGGTGDDNIFGGDGTDRLYGADGNDTIVGGGARDELYGGNGTDQLFGQAGPDWLCGQNGLDGFADVSPEDQVCRSDLGEI